MSQWKMLFSIILKGKAPKIGTPAIVSFLGLNVLLTLTL